MVPNTVSSLPIPAGTYVVDRNHSGVYFHVRHLGISNVRGMFKTFEAVLVVGDALDDVNVTATIDLSSVDTNQPDRDAHLLSTDFFHADTHPQMNFRSSAVQQVDDHDYEIDGDLELNGITKPVTLKVQFDGAELNPTDQRTHVGFTATGDIRRSDFGIDFNMPLGAGKLALSDKVKIEIDAQFVAP